MNQYLHTQLCNPPAIGEGRHHWLFRVALGLRNSGASLPAIEEYLRKGCELSGWGDRAGRTIDDILAKLDADHNPQPRAPQWPNVNHQKRHARSAVSPLFDPDGDTGLSAVDVLSKLFRADELVCVGRESCSFRTMSLEEALPLAAGMQFVVPNPMVAPFAPNGSRRCKQNASPPDTRRYTVVEFDQGEPRSLQASVLTSLHTDQTPLAMAVWSAGKSIHGWYNVSRLSPHQKLQFFRYAVHFGADKSLWGTEQLVRMPGGQRNGQRQAILYFKEAHL